MAADLIRLDNVFNYLPKTVRRELNDDDQILSWALQALRTVNHTNKLVKSVSFHDIVNHKITLPVDLKKVYKVSYATEEPDDLTISTLCSCEAQTDSSTFTIDKDCRPLYHRLFLTSDYYLKCFTPMQYKKVRLTDQYVCNVNWGGCYGFYSLNTTGTMMTFSEKSGFVVIEYFAEPKDDYGNFLVPDLVSLWNGLADYITAKFYQDRAVQKEQNANQLYQQYLLSSRNWLNDARGYFKLNSIDLAMHRHLIYSDSRIMKAHLLVRHDD